MNDSNASFFGGAIMAIGGNLQWLLSLHDALLQSGVASHVVIEWSIKVVGTFILGIVGGVSGLLGKALFNYLKKKIVK
jgi:hypothetical protein